MAVDPWAGLTPEERKLYGLDGDKGAPGGATGAPAPTTTAAPAAPPAGADAPATGILPALAGGVVHGGGDVLNAPAAWVGAKPLVDASGVYGAAQQQHPWAAGIGRAIGQVGATVPLILGGEFLAPEYGAAALAARVASNPLLRGVVAGGIGGAEQNLLTAGEDPNEPWYKRAGLGAVTGGAVGGVFGKLGQAFGEGTSLASPEVQKAAQTAQQEGVSDIRLGNLPLAGGNVAAAAKGVQATMPQAQQVTRAFGEVMGDNFTDLGPTTLPAKLTAWGQDVANTAAKGHVNYSLIEPDLVRIESDAAAGQGMHFAPIKRILDDISGKAAAGNGVISGADMQSLIQHNGMLDKATRNLAPEISGPANDIEGALKDGFMQSSSPTVANDYSVARGKYKLGLALESNVKDSGVNNHTLVNPGTIYNTLKQNKWIGDIDQLGAGNTMFDRVANLARASDTLFGGGAPQQASHLGLLAQLGGAGIGGGTLTGLLHTPIPAGAALAYGGYRLAQALGQRYQATSPRFVNRLIQSGTAPAPNLLSPGGWGRGVTTALPGTINAPASQ